MKLTQGNPFEDTRQLIKWPSLLFFVMYTAISVMAASVTIYFDEARGFTFILIPIILAEMLCTEANIVWGVTQVGSLIKNVLFILYGAGGFVFLLLVSSVEDGNPISPAWLNIFIQWLIHS